MHTTKWKLNTNQQDQGLKLLICRDKSGLLIENADYSAIENY